MTTAMLSTPRVIPHCFRVLGYQTYPAPFPSVQMIKVKTPAQVEYLLLESKQSCDMLVYFNRPHVLNHLKYTELYKKYVCLKDLSNGVFK